MTQDHITGPGLVNPVAGPEVFVEVSDAESKVDETTRWPKQKCTSRKLVLDGCLCRSVLNGSMDGVLRCKEIGCETEWVSGAYLK